MPNLTSLSGISAGNSAEECRTPDAWLSRDGSKAMTDAEREARIESGQLGIARDYPIPLYRAAQGPSLRS